MDFSQSVYLSYGGGLCVSVSVYLLVYFPFAVINATTKSNSGKKGFIWLIGHSLSLREVRVGIQGRNESREQ